LFEEKGWENCTDMIDTCCGALVNKSEWKFVYTGVVIDHLKEQLEGEEQLSMEIFQRCIEKLPDGLDDCYKKSFEKDCRYRQIVF
jgi:hypothetical protein